jgi:hypothetical protein
MIKAGRRKRHTTNQKGRRKKKRTAGKRKRIESEIA